MTSKLLGVAAFGWALMALMVAGVVDARAQGGSASYRFDFGPGRVAAGYTQVSEATAYTKERGYGFEPGARVECVDRGGRDALGGDFCTGDKPFFFSVAVPEGNYRVTVTLGDARGESVNTVKAELRRLMLERVETARGKSATRTFTVNVRTPEIAGGERVRLKDREKPALRWDDKLTLELNGKRPGVKSTRITPRPDAITVFLAGDSTVTDQFDEPWAAWGQMLPRFFKPGVAVANHAESGESLRSFRGAKRRDKILSQIKSGDYLFIQFGHNDMKEKGEGVGPFTTFKRDLEEFVALAREKGATAVLVT
ncbi:MAG TPA: SGNH/GDSL hydrolase family protein, partial [Pyrinomonadaceae bacterium]|nr:SGNH/GDSL hydrolase family protein [Pyrinomonadaceae bacterium]